jgi:hypothetical protein
MHLYKPNQVSCHSRLTHLFLIYKYVNVIYLFPSLMKLDLSWEAQVSDRIGVWGWPSSEVSLYHMAYAWDVSILSSSLQCSLPHILPTSQRRWVVWHISYWRLEYHITQGCWDSQDFNWASPKCMSCLRYLTCWLYCKHDNTLSLVLDCVSTKKQMLSVVHLILSMLLHSI